MGPLKATTNSHIVGFMKTIGMSSQSKYSETDVAYLAGLFDGEGCLKLSGRRGRSINLDICNTYLPVLEWAYATFGGYICTQERSAAEIEKGHRRRFHWTVFSAESIEKILKLMLPYLKIKKDQTVLALKFLDTVFQHCGQPLTDAENKEREKLVTAIKESRWHEWPAIPKRRWPMLRCACGKKFRQKSTTHTYCSVRCHKRIYMRKVREDEKSKGWV